MLLERLCSVGVNVEYCVLLERLFSVGVNGKSWRLLCSWDNVRCIDGTLSPDFCLERGVRQDSLH